MRWSIFLASGGLAKWGNVLQLCEQCTMQSVQRHLSAILRA